MTRRTPNGVFRISVLRLFTILVFAILIGQLAVLQFVRGAGYQERAVFNRVRVVRTEGERGVIYDRDGRILARNSASFDVSVIPADLPDDPDVQRSAELRRALYVEVINLLQEAMAAEVNAQPVEADGATRPASRYIVGENLPPSPRILSVDEIEALVNQREAGSAYAPVPVAENLPRSVAMRIEEQRYRLPGVEIGLRSRREYPSGVDTAHLIGYMGPIPETEAQFYRDQGYATDAWVGWTGLELTFEDRLHGKQGRRVIEVDVNGRERAVLNEPEPPQPGQNLNLSLDLELQRAMEQAMLKYINPKRSSSAAAIAIDPKTGFVLGMVSLPTYDNNVFADGITEDEYTTIANAPGIPLLNHAIGGLYPPGSTFKLVPAAAGLQEGVIDANTLLNDPGIIYLPNRNFPDNPLLAQPFVCWIYKLGGYHGDINVTEALAESCDVFFYKLGGGWYQTEFEGLGEERIAEYAQAFGFGEQTGIDLPGESAGLVPTSKWKRITKGERWVTGDTYNESIGQGDVLSTPLQVAQMTAAVANGGNLYRPQLVESITDGESQLVERMQPELIRQLPVDPQHLQTVREGMWMAVNWQNGTAPAAALPDVTIAGKTGTSEFYDPEIPRDGAGNLPTHAWFTAFAPYEDPEIVVTVFVYNGGEGSEVAVPITREILRAYFDMKNADATTVDPANPDQPADPDQPETPAP